MYPQCRPHVHCQIFLPELSLAIEYNGEYHYAFVSVYGDFETVQQRDKAKKLTCHSHGITLITVPYWWDYKITSVAATIHMARPDITMPVSLTGTPIPTDVPSKPPSE